MRLPVYAYLYTKMDRNMHILFTNIYNHRLSHTLSNNPSYLTYDDDDQDHHHCCNYYYFYYYYYYYYYYGTLPYTFANE